MGDRFGRRGVLVMTLVLMGAATALVGILPTYAQIGAWAPALLMTLRILQGFSAGGEWGGAALMAVEFAPTEKRSLFGSFPANRHALGHDPGDGRAMGADFHAWQAGNARMGDGACRFCSRSC